MQKVISKELQNLDKQRQGQAETTSGPSLQGSWREGLGALRRRVNGLKGIGMRVLDVKGFKPTGGE